MPPKKDEESPLEELQQTLDTPGADVSGSFERHGLHSDGRSVPLDWGQAPAAANTEPPLRRMALSKKHHTVAKWLFGLAVVFFLVAAGVAAYFLTGNRNILSADKIDITVTGPSTISAGEVVPLAIEIINSNASTLEVADLLVEYPPGTRSADDVTQELLRTRVGLGDLAPGSRIATSSKAVIFGEEGSKYDIVVSLEYRVAGSNAIFVKERAFTVEIDDSPVAISVNASKTVNSGDTVTFDVTIRSNSTAPIEDLVIKADYPFGFSFTSGSPEPSFSDSFWSFGDIEPGGERSLVVRGTLEGQNEEERVFRFDIGVQGAGDPTNIGTSYARAEHAVTIARPFIDLGLAVGGDDTSPFVMLAGQDATIDISWRNNLSGKLSDGTIDLEIDGTAFNESAFRPGTGFYDSSKNVARWDRRTTQSLSLLDGGDTGRVNATLKALSLSDLAGKVVNPTIELKLSFRGVPVSASDAPEQVRTEVLGTARVATDATLTSQILRSTGPVPPRAEMKTVYSVVWEVASSVNDVTGAHVTAVLPPYVSWEGVVSPSDEDIVFDASTGRVDWSVGTIRAGAGYSAPTRSVAFQIGFTPSVTQVGDVPTLVRSIALSGTDGFAGTTVTDAATDATTRLDEPGFKSSDAEVVN